MKVQEHGGHYYVDPTMWDQDKVMRAASQAADKTRHTQLIHPHKQEQKCGVHADHIVVFPDGHYHNVRLTEKPERRGH